MGKRYPAGASLAAILGILMSAASAEATEGTGNDADVRALPLSMSTQVDAGQVVHGHVNDQPLKEQFLQRTAVWLTQEVVIKDRLSVKAGIGGVFWYAIPGGELNGDAAHKNLTRFGPGISQVQAIYSFGALESPSAKIQMGLFPYKYNPDAMNLGEYLLRSGTYPGILQTGGWNIVSKAAYMMQGVRLNVPLWDGRFQSDFLLPMERDIAPMGDLSPTYVASLRPVAGLEIGAGADCNHCIAFKPSRTSPKKLADPNDPSGNPGNAYIIANPDVAGRDTLPYIRDTTRFYTFQGVKLMGRVSLDPKAYFASDLLGAEDLKVFAELAVLGVKNYPFLYEKVGERMPIMFGVNLPTFKLLDVLSFQMEHYKSKFPNSSYDLYYFNLPIVNGVTKNGIRTQNPNTYDMENSAVRRDDWKWSVYAKREIAKGISIYAQVANDHLRVPAFDLKPSWTQITDRNGKDYYYMVRFEMGI
ncbi:MAG: hypothetical protein JWP91_3673 [Fibrobacteres bacterium]|nr:hypothetical protein [Fibrobacterota bacterium]